MNFFNYIEIFWKAYIINEKYIDKFIMFIKSLGQFLKIEAAGGIILFFAAFLAIILDNSPLAFIYNAFLNFHLSVHIGPLFLAKSILHWINDGLMVLFFLLVGLELKREMCHGYLSKFSDVILPMIAALGGMIFPALIYYSLNYHNPLTLKGWAIPVATDIAFALAIISLLGKRVPMPLKLFLLAVTIFDDIGAIVIIAIFHTHDLSYVSLLCGLLVVLLLILLNRFRVQKILPYGILGFILWVCVLKSGVHATLAGIILAFTIPADSMSTDKASPLDRLETSLAPWVGFVIVPLFGFANSGISFTNEVPGVFSNRIVWGIILGLFFGKQLGIFLFTWICVVLRWCKLPKQTTWFELYSIGVVCGIGFTMSLFIGALSFTGQAAEPLISVRFGVLMASMLSGIIGYGLLYLSLRNRVNEG